MKTKVTPPSPILCTSVHHQEQSERANGLQNSESANNYIRSKDAPVVSVIIPCYHVSEYINDVFEDLCKQSFVDSEYIFVNDGDLSLAEILEEFKSRDPRTRVITQENQGVSTARNNGIKAAQGEWIVFVDPDDRLEKWHLEKLVEAVRKYDVPFAIGGFRVLQTRVNRVGIAAIKNVPNEGICCKPQDYFDQILCSKSTMWSKIIHRQWMIDRQLFFRPEMSKSEDTELYMRILENVENVAFVQDTGYVYVTRDSDSALKRYSKDYVESVSIVHQSMLSMLRSKIDDERVIEDYMIKKVGADDFIRCVHNYFLLGSDLSLIEAARRIKEEILENNFLMSYYNKYVNSNRDWSLYTKLFAKLMSLRIPLLVAMFCKTSRYLKENNIELFYRIRPWLLRRRVK